MRKAALLAVAVLMIAACGNKNQEQKQDNMNQELTLTQEWDKVFPQSDKVDHKKVTFKNRFGITLVADMYTPKNATGKLPAIAVSGPFGAVKEQSSGLYAQTLAERGFITIAFDPSYTGESGGEPRYVSSPDINTEDFSAAVDFLSLQDNVDPERIGILGVCGWGGIALNAAALDPRIKATLATTMYDMSRVTQNGYHDDGDSKEARNAMRKTLAEQRLADLRNGSYECAGGVVEDPTGAPWFVQQYHAYYKTPRGYHARSLNSNKGWNKTSALPWLNASFLKFTNEIDNAVLILHGEKAHSRYFGITAYENMTGEKVALQGQDANLQPLNEPLAEPFIVTRDNKQLYIVPNATHCDLYDGGESNYIPFDYIEQFYKENLK
ncbi:MAG: alpha/beta hydrolase [Bacteroidales bacterium]|nr:alpha/beta hydrolase [Bacteroidales bacterium]MBR0539038.1 alpha/beta hydrolase [Bacteroidales bacterium]